VTANLPNPTSITTPVDLIRWLLKAAIEHEPARLYAEPVAAFTDTIIERLLGDGNVQDLKFPPDETPSLLTSLMASFSGEMVDTGRRPCSPVLVRVASDLYACNDAGIERATWLLLDALNMSPRGRDLFEQLELRAGDRRSQRFVVSTALFEQEFGHTIMVPMASMSFAHRYQVRQVSHSELWPEYSAH
jgi:hypothetical protein